LEYGIYSVLLTLRTNSGQSHEIQADPLQPLNKDGLTDPHREKFRVSQPAVSLSFT